jgi:hypothetical protein
MWLSLITLIGALPAWATPAVNLSGRVVVDGFADDYTDDETLFQLSPGGVREESTIDSQWGRFNDINNIRLTWDADFVYVAVEGFIFDNNTMIFFDTLPSPDGQNEGWETFSSMEGGWRRAVSFDNGLRPEVFLATWDGNTTPQLWTYTGLNRDTQVPEGSFATVATFSRDLAGRCMEAAIPWDTFFLQKGTREFVAAYGDTVYRLPEGVREIKLVAWITTGADGLGGPDSAPDNLSGMQVDSAVPVLLDNFVRITVDSLDANGDPGPDGIPDFGAPVRIPTTPAMTDEEYRAVAQASFFLPPPIRGTALEMQGLEITPKAIAPEMGDQARFRFGVTPRIEDPNLREARRLNFTAELYDVNGKRVKTIYRDEPFTLDELEAAEPPERNTIDGRGEDGQMLSGGVYLLRVVLEPGQDQVVEGMVVVR